MRPQSLKTLIGAPKTSPLNLSNFSACFLPILRAKKDKKNGPSSWDSFSELRWKFWVTVVSFESYESIFPNYESFGKRRHISENVPPLQLSGFHPCSELAECAKTFRRSKSCLATKTREQCHSKEPLIGKTGGRSIEMEKNPRWVPKTRVFSPTLLKIQLTRPGTSATKNIIVNSNYT